MKKSQIFPLLSAIGLFGLIQCQQSTSVDDGGVAPLSRPTQPQPQNPVPSIPGGLAAKLDLSLITSGWIDSQVRSNPKIEALEAYSWNGKLVIQVHETPECCDQFSGPVVNLDKEIICYPSGGFSGSGDFKCPDFSTKADFQAVLYINVESESAQEFLEKARKKWKSMEPNRYQFNWYKERGLEMGPSDVKVTVMDSKITNLEIIRERALDSLFRVDNKDPKYWPSFSIDSLFKSLDGWLNKPLGRLEYSGGIYLDPTYSYPSNAFFRAKPICTEQKKDSSLYILDSAQGTRVTYQYDCSGVQDADVGWKISAFTLQTLTSIRRPKK